MDIDEGRPLARSEDKYRRVCRKLIHHYAYRTRPHFDRFFMISEVVSVNNRYQISILGHMAKCGPNLFAAWQNSDELLITWQNRYLPYFYGPSSMY
jgi:hypothetical protein